jgi:transcriptional regulator with XRE-family HTH domain
MDRQIAARIKEAREVKGMTQEDLAAAAKLSQAAISGIESGAAKDIKISNLQRIAKALGVRVAWLIGEE